MELLHGPLEKVRLNLKNASPTLLFTRPLAPDSVLLVLSLDATDLADASLPHLPARGFISSTAFPAPPRPIWYTGVLLWFSTTRASLSNSSSKEKIRRSAVAREKVLPAPPRPDVKRVFGGGDGSGAREAGPVAVAPGVSEAAE